MLIGKHSVTLDTEKCKGCTNCLMRCPTEAIRIRGGKAVILSELCIDCGECIRACPQKAKKAMFDRFEDFASYPYKIALPAPVLLGQFEKLDEPDKVLNALLRCGFDEVFEVSRAAELVSEYTRAFLKENKIPKPVISTSCPAIVRLISIRFPELLPNLLTLLSPMELAARLARKEAMEKNPDLREEDICVLFLSPCPAKISYIRNPVGIEKTAINGALAISDFFFRIRSQMKTLGELQSLSQTGSIGLSWASTGGEATALFADRYLAADGMENVIRVLDEIENNTFHNLEFVELNACPGGCVGGVLNVENPYIAKARLRYLRKYRPLAQNHLVDGGYTDDFYKWTDSVDYTPVGNFTGDRKEILRKMAEIKELDAALPGMDCGACGAPGCHALAEDIVRGNATIDSCVILWKKREIEDCQRTKEENAK